MPPAARVAVFDNDGTLWCEKPMVIQMDFILRQMVAHAASQPELCTQQPWTAAWEQDFAWFDEAMTKHYLGDRSAMRVVLGALLALSKGRVAEAAEANARTYAGPGLLRLRLSADAGAAALSVPPRLQQLHRLRRAKIRGASQKPAKARG